MCIAIWAALLIWAPSWEFTAVVQRMITGCGWAVRTIGGECAIRWETIVCGCIGGGRIWSGWVRRGGKSVSVSIIRCAKWGWCWPTGGFCLLVASGCGLPTTPKLPISYAIFIISINYFLTLTPHYSLLASHFMQSPHPTAITSSSIPSTSTIVF